MFSGPSSHPCSDTGRLQSDINRIDREVSRKADQHEISTITGNVGRLEHSIREISSICDGILFRLETIEERLSRAPEEPY